MTICRVLQRSLHFAQRMMCAMKTSKRRLSSEKALLVRSFWQNSAEIQLRSNGRLRQSGKMYCSISNRYRTQNLRKTSCSVAIILSLLAWSIFSRRLSVFTLLCHLCGAVSFTRSLKLKKDCQKKLFDSMRFKFVSPSDTYTPKASCIVT